MQHGDKRIALYPADRLQDQLHHQLRPPAAPAPAEDLDLDEQVFIDEIAPARTFGFLKEVEMLRQRGLALGGSLENAIVLGETGVLNPLRFEDEFVRHKILDVIGDLALVGHPIQGHLVVHRGGHALHTAFASELVRQRDAGGLPRMSHLPPTRWDAPPRPVPHSHQLRYRSRFRVRLRAYGRLSERRAQPALAG